MKSLKQRRRQRLVLANNCEVELCHKWTDWGDKFDRVAAPLASELLPKLPDYVEEDGKRSYLKLGKHNMYPGVEYSCRYVSLEEGRGFTKGFCVDNNMADPVAQTYLHLRKASLI